jgi:hypothetical protein
MECVCRMVEIKRLSVVQVKFLLKLLDENYMCNTANWKKIIKIWYLLAEMNIFPIWNVSEDKIHRRRGVCSAVPGDYYINDVQNCLLTCHWALRNTVRIDYGVPRNLKFKKILFPFLCYRLMADTCNFVSQGMAQKYFSKLTTVQSCHVSTTLMQISKDSLLCSYSPLANDKGMKMNNLHC